MVIILDSFSAIDELGTNIPEVDETRASLNVVNRTNGLSDTFCCIFHRSGFRTESIEVRTGGDTRTVFGSVVSYCIVNLDC